MSMNQNLLRGTKNRCSARIFGDLEDPDDPVAQIDGREPAWGTICGNFSA